MGHREDFAFILSEMEPLEGSEHVFSPDLAVGNQQLGKEAGREVVQVSSDENG